MCICEHEIIMHADITCWYYVLVGHRLRTCWRCPACNSRGGAPSGSCSSSSSRTTSAVTWLLLPVLRLVPMPPLSTVLYSHHAALPECIVSPISHDLFVLRGLHNRISNSTISHAIVTSMRFVSFLPFSGRAGLIFDSASPSPKQKKQV